MPLNVNLCNKQCILHKKKLFLRSGELSLEKQYFLQCFLKQWCENNGRHYSTKKKEQLKSKTRSLFTIITNLIHLKILFFNQNVRPGLLKNIDRTKRFLNTQYIIIQW